MKKNYILFTLAFCLSSCASQTTNTADISIIEQATTQEIAVNVSEDKTNSLMADSHASSCFNCLNITDYSYCHEGAFAITISNDSDMLVKNVDLKITGKAIDGSIVGTNTYSLYNIYPDRLYYNAFNNFIFDEEPDTIEVELLDNSNFKASAVPEWYSSFVEPTFGNIFLQDDNTKIAGELSNNMDLIMDSRKIFLIFRNSEGKIQAHKLACVNYSGEINPLSSVPFEIPTIYDDLSSLDYELYIQL